MASTYTSIEELNAFPDGGSIDNSLLAVHIAGSQTYKMSVSDFNRKSTESAQHYAELAEEAYDGSVAIQQAIQASTTAATTAATNAGISEANAAASEAAAATAAQEAAASATSLANAVTSARNSANAALSYEEGAEDAATLARSWAEGGTNTRQGENTNNAEYWAQYAERYAQGGLHYKGSIPFVDIPTTGMREGDMYNITDDFTTDSRFEEGAGIEVKGGTNIAWNSDDKWDVLAVPPKTTFNGRSGSILPMAGDYDSEKILLASVLHIGGETQENAQEALEALEGNKADKVDNAVEDNFAGLDANGNLKDSGKNAGDFATPSDIAGQQSLLKDTVGWTGKNRAYSQTNNAVIAHIENGITYDVSWTGSATITLKKNSASGATITSGSTSPLSFMADADYELYFGSSATVTNIMVKDSRITDPTYEPYHESVEVMYEEEIHGVNLFQNALIGLTFYGDDNLGYRLGTEPDAANAVSYIAKISQNTGYTISRSSGKGDRFRIILFKNSPSTTQGEGKQVVFDNSLDSYTFNSGTYNYIGFNANKTLSVTSDDIKAMLRKADIEDSTYRPYNYQAIQNQLNAQGVLGAKNLLQNTATTQTINGVTFTVNSDGSITGVGTSNSSDMAYFVTGSGWGNSGKLLSETEIKAGETYILSKGFVKSGIALFIRFYQGSTDLGGISTKDEDNKKFTVPTNTDHIVAVIRIDSGVTISNSNVFYPMLRLASDPDDTYQPYAMTNRELTEKVNTYGILLPPTTDLNDIIENGIYFANNITTNAPTGISSNYYGLIVMAWDNSNVRQLLVAKDAIYTRSKGGSPVVWSSWYKYTGAVVS